MKYILIIIFVFGCNVAWGHDGHEVPESHDTCEWLQSENIRYLHKEVEFLKAKIAELEKGKSYTVKEIDELREACEARWWYGTTKRGAGHGRSTIMGSGEEDIGIEQLVRTFMIAGKTAKDIYEEDGK